MSLVLGQFPGFHFFGGYFHVIRSDTALSGTVESEGECILGAGPREGNSRVFSVLPLTPRGIESLSETQWVIHKTGLNLFSLSKK